MNTTVIINFIYQSLIKVPFAGFKVEEGANFIHSFGDPETAPIWKLKLLKSVRGIIRSDTFAIR